MTCSDVLEIIGSLVSSLKSYAAKLPAVVHLSTIAQGLKPTLEAADGYEQAVYRHRERSGSSPYRRFNDLLIESLEAFEAGNLIGAIQPLLTVIDHLEVLQRDKEINATPAEEKRLTEYRAALNRILPGNQPELEGAGRGI